MLLHLKYIEVHSQEGIKIITETFNNLLKAFDNTGNTNIVDTVKYAISMSTITISTEETIHPDMSHELVKEYMDKIEWIEVNYNKLKFTIWKKLCII